jgi:hypothetical protein
LLIELKENDFEVKLLVTEKDNIYVVNQALEADNGFKN